MAFLRKIILHSPVSDEGLVDNFVEQRLADGVSLAAIVGPGSSRLEEQRAEAAQTRVPLGGVATPDSYEFS